jgi:D-alanyl-D-alanine carboxypeptidase/D-alanyl-D-alanine-endopeptidase (penicillin-binding protein 4)
LAAGDWRLAAVLISTAVAAAACASHQPLKATPAPASSAVRELRGDLTRIFAAPINERGVWGVEIRSLDTGERLFDLNAGRLMMPASNMKILTLATAAATLGWDYRFTTTLEARGTISEGVLHGDLIIKSNGDPTINTRDERATAVLDEWAQALRAAGIQSIDGRVIGNDQAFDDEGIGAGWAWDYLQYGYAAPVGALEFNENLAMVTVAPASEATGRPVVMLQAGSGLELLNHTTTGATGTEDTIDYRRHLERPILEVTGSIPLGAQPETRTVAVVNPTVFFAQSVTTELAGRGIAVSGPATDFDDVAAEFFTSEAVSDPGGGNRPKVVAITKTESPPLRDIATVLMKVSQNLYAETLLKAISASGNGLGTTEGGRIAVRKMLSDWGIPADSYVMYDGSGLSRYNYVTAATLVDVLEHLYKDPRHRDAFLSTLPIAGKDGTISTRLRGTRAEGNALAKTGSIANTRALSGFVKTRDGEMLVFSILANDFVIPSATINLMADLAVESLANFTRR